MHDIFPHFVILKGHPIATFFRIRYYIHMLAITVRRQVNTSFLTLQTAKAVSCGEKGGYPEICMKKYPPHTDLA
jgi:hypothetical protein